MAGSTLRVTLAHVQEHQPKMIICSTCGVTCLRQGQAQKYCSDCRRRRKNEQNRINARKYLVAAGKNVTGAKIVCAICREVFNARQGGNKYCSAECRRKFEAGERTRKRIANGLKTIGTTVISCISCSAEIGVTGPSHKYCVDCRKVAAAKKSARWRASHRKKVVEIQRAHDERRKHDPRRIKMTREYAKRKARKRTADPEKNLHHRMSQLVRSTLRSGKAGRTWLSMVPYTVEDLAIHLERQFVDGMTWENMGQWQIDHILPRSMFSFSSPDDGDFIACWAITNLRPIWARDNREKSNKRTLLI